jgi:APA family basic amino acid/polyamine antiporter
VGIILLLCAKGSRPLHLFKTKTTAGGPAFSLARFGIALVAVLFAYEGWHVVSFVAGEMKRPQSDLPRGLFYGTGIIMLIYLAANIGYYHLLSPSQIRGSDAVAAFTVGKLLGPTARSVISILILVSILGSLNGMVLTGPRVYYAMARDGTFPGLFGRMSNRYCTPMPALIVQGVWAAVLAVSGSYQQLFTDVIFTAWIFYGLAVGAVLILRRTQPQIKRVFRVPGYPWVPLLFCMAAIGLVVSTIVERPEGALVGIALIASGVPVYAFLARSTTNRNREAESLET